MLFKISKVDGLCTNNIFHYSEKSLKLIKNTLLKKKFMSDQNNTLKLKFCKKCLMSNARPRIRFDPKVYVMLVTIYGTK